MRFVAASNRDLKAMSNEGKFRSDLYYRLTGLVITVPPLRERIDGPDQERERVPGAMLC